MGLASFLARAQYDYKGKYLLSAAIRADGSSRFGKNNRWGYFPSVSVGWRVISEEFMEDINWISNLKLRASYGISGNFNIGNYEHIALLSYNQYVLGKGEGTLVSGLRPSQLPNDDLSWEKTRMYNVGLDVGLFKDRLTFELDLYQSNTYDLLLDVPIPQITGFLICVRILVRFVIEVLSLQLVLTIIGTALSGMQASISLQTGIKY